MSIFRFEAVEIELATTRGSPLQWLVAGLMTPVVSTLDGISMEPVIVCVVSGGIVSGFFICTLYSFLLRVYSSVSIEYVRWGKQALAHVQDGAVIFKEREAKYWACQSFGHDKCFLKIPVSDFELEDDCFGGCFNVAICDLEFERGWFQLFNYDFGGHLEDFIVIGFAVYEGARVNKGVQCQVLEVHGGEEHFLLLFEGYC